MQPHLALNSSFYEKKKKAPPEVFLCFLVIAAGNGLRIDVAWVPVFPERHWFLSPHLLRDA